MSQENVISITKKFEKKKHKDKGGAKGQKSEVTVP